MPPVQPANPPGDLPTLRVFFLAAEAEPFVKVGGLGDVSGSLPRALAALPSGELGFNLEIILALPFHPAIRKQALQVEGCIPFAVVSSAGAIPGQAHLTHSGLVRVMLVDGPPIPVEGPVYSMDTGRDGDKFTFFSLGALAAARQMGWKPDILHANDWHTAAAVYALSLLRASDPFFASVKTVLTVHNLPFIGVGTAPSLEKYGIPPLSETGLPPWAEQLPLPVGLACADRIVAVSPGYCREILSADLPGSMEAFLQSRRSRLTGILNGIDFNAWNPETDKVIPARYNAASLERRQANKASLLAELSLPGSSQAPLAAFIGRMDPQKGIDLILDAAPSLADLEWQLVILGTGDEQLEAGAQDLVNRFPGRVCTALRYDNQLARRIYAGADLLLMPSRYEPCGLAQMIAMRYGCLPLARSTGGLADTIQAWPEDPLATGFLFHEAAPLAFGKAFRLALAVFAQQDRWRQMQVNAMTRDFSWQRSAYAYAHLYQQVAEES